MDVETGRGALFSQCILSCELMALVYIYNTITWIQMWKQCVWCSYSKLWLQNIHRLDVHL